MIEKVVCIPNGLIKDGVCLDPKILDKIGPNRFWATRDKSDKSEFSLEQNTSIRQLVVYPFMMTYDGNFWIYKRDSKDGENRLHGGYACPGGHMNSLSGNFLEDITRDTMREIQEETTNKTEDLFGFSDEWLSRITTISEWISVKPIAAIQTSINGPSDNNVHRVHTGIISVVQLREQPRLNPNEGKELVPVNENNYTQYFEGADLWLQMLLSWIPQMKSFLV